MLPTFKQDAVQKLKELKRTYVQYYIALHKKSRLGPNDDKKKSKLLADARLEKLKKLATISLMPSAHLEDFQNKLASLVPCFSLTEQEINDGPKCLHCAYSPNADASIVPALQVLQSLDMKLDDLLEEWTSVLLTNLEDPTTQKNINLLKADDKKHVEKFLKKRELPDKLEHDFIHALQEVLSGLIKIEIKTSDIKDALAKGGTPATLDELKSRFETYLSERTKGQDQTKIRIVLD
jgi:hypothetical protein